MRLLLLALLAALAVALAAVAVLVPRLRATAAQGGILAAAGAVALLVFTGGKSDGAGSVISAPPPPLQDAFVTSAAVGTYAVGVAVRNEGGGLRTRATVLDQQGLAQGLDVSLDVSGHELDARPCGAGCYEATAPGNRLSSLAVSVDGERRALRVPEAWPAPGARAIVHRATTTFRRLRTVTFVSTLGPTTTLWKAHAPNRLSGLELHNGSAAVIIGNRRWDRDSKMAPWVRSAQSPIRQPQPPWPARFQNAHVLGSFVVRNRPVWRVTFLDPLTPSWFTIDVDKQTGRTYGMNMIAQAHFMREDYSRFDQPTPILPPR